MINEGLYQIQVSSLFRNRRGAEDAEGRGGELRGEVWVDLVLGEFLVILWTEKFP